MNNPVTHIAFIMDGNGRWAKARRLPRIEGHRRGLNTAERTIDACLALGVKYVTLYVFSTENWKRDKKEVDGLFDLAYRYIDRFEVFCRDKARVVVSGRRDRLPDRLLGKIVEIEQETAHFDKICVNLLIDYGGQNDIADACAKVCASGRNDCPIFCFFRRRMRNCNFPIRCGRTSRKRNSAVLLPITRHAPVISEV